VWLLCMLKPSLRRGRKGKVEWEMFFDVDIMVEVVNILRMS